MACTSYKDLHESLSQGLVSKAHLDIAVARVLSSKFKLGVFDPPDKVPYAKLGEETLGAPEHLAKAREAAARGAHAQS